MCWLQDCWESERILIEAKRIASEEEAAVMMITECGTAERAMAESEKPIELMGTCSMCRHMKKTHLRHPSSRSPRGDKSLR